MCVSAGIKRLGNSGKVQYAYLLLIASFAVLLGFCVLDNRMVIQVRDRVDNVLTLSGFSGTLCDYGRISDSMSVIKKEEKGQVIYDFEKMYGKTALYIREEGIEERVSRILEKNLSEDGMMRNLVTGYALDELILYNEPVSADTVAPNGVIMTEPGIYLRVKLNIRGIMGKIHTVYLDKCIMVKWNLQI